MRSTLAAGQDIHAGTIGFFLAPEAMLRGIDTYPWQQKMPLRKIFATSKLNIRQMVVQSQDQE